MYIISKRKDYYDGVAGTTGIDKTIVYNRDIIELDEEKYPKIFRRYHALNNTKPSPFYRLSNVSVKKELKVVYEHVAPFIIGFCGKIYVEFIINGNYFDSFVNKLRWNRISISFVSYE